MALPYEIVDGEIRRIGSNGRWGLLTRITGCEMSSFRKFIVPKGVAKIAPRFFSQCQSLSSVIIPDSVTFIGENAFEGCNDLTSIHIADITLVDAEHRPACVVGFAEEGRSFADENGKKYLDYMRFHAEDLIDPALTHPSLFRLMIRKKVIGKDLLDRKMDDILLSGNAEMIAMALEYEKQLFALERNASPAGFMQLSDGSGSSLPYEIVDGEIRRPADFEDWVFEPVYQLNPILEKITNFAVPSAVTKIGALFFSDCANLSCITIPDSVTLIGEGAFIGCKSLTSIALPGNVTFIGSGAFEECSSLQSVNIPDSVIAIGNRAFKNCSSLTNIVISDAIREIGYGMFDSCHSLRSIVLPDSVTFIGQSAFRCCCSLTSITIPDSVKSIGAFAFSDCINLADITLPKNLIPVGNSVFHGCGKLADENGFVIICGVLYDYIGMDQSVTILDHVTAIADRAFSGCWDLAHVTISSSVTSIGDGAFEDCWNLTHITVSDSVMTIGDEAFTNCHNLTNIILPNSVTSIGDKAFYACHNLNSITISEKTEHIGSRVFEGCCSLTIIHIADLTQIDEKNHPACCVGFAEDGRSFEDENGKKYLEYMSSHVEALLDMALEHPALFHLLVRENMIGEGLLNEKMYKILCSGSVDMITTALEYKSRLAAEAKHDFSETDTMLKSRKTECADTVQGCKEPSDPEARQDPFIKFVQ